jgi:hypothetical protein
MNLTYLLAACAIDAGRMEIPADAAAVWLYGPDALCPLMVVVLRPERPEAATPKVWGIVLGNAVRKLARGLPVTPRAAVLLFPLFENLRMLEAAGAGAQEATAIPYLGGAVAGTITIHPPAARSAAAVLLAQAQQIHAAHLN